MSLGDLVRQDRGSDSPKLSIIADLSVAIEKAVEDEYVNGDPDRVEGWHPSELMDMCPRFEVLRQLIPGVVGKKSFRPTPKAKLVFDVGTALHRWWQDQYFGPMGVLVGNWDCPRCGYMVEDQTMPLTPCPNCMESFPERPIELGRNSLWRFREVPVSDPELGIIGHSDGLYLLGKGTMYEERAVLEMKTAGPNFWTNGARPYPANIFQINLYMWLTKTKKGFLLYIDKGGAAATDLMCKEVVVDYDDRPHQQVKTKIEAYRDAVKAKILPPKMAVCELTPNQARPRLCAFGDVCLSDRKSHEVVEKWGEVALK
jgi:hypothetical protein